MTTTPAITYLDYQPHGAARELFGRRQTEVVLCGPAGTGKSRAGLEKLHWCCVKYPHVRGLLVRHLVTGRRRHTDPMAALVDAAAALDLRVEVPSPTDHPLVVDLVGRYG